MRRLHAGDDPQLSKFWDVLRPHHLGMLDTMPAGGAVSSGGCVSKHGKSKAIGTVSDGVNCDLIPSLHELLSALLELLWLQQQQTSLGWLVAVWRFERCSSRPEGAIQPEFDRPHREVFALKGSSLEVRGVLVPLPVGHCIDPQRQGAGLVPLLQDGESRLVSSRVMNAGESDLGAFAERCAQSRLKLLGLHWRQFGVDQSNGIVDENAGGLAVGISNDSTALGIRRR